METINLSYLEYLKLKFGEEIKLKVTTGCGCHVETEKPIVVTVKKIEEDSND